MLTTFCVLDHYLISLRFYYGASLALLRFYYDASLVDCHMSAGNVRELRDVHGRHQLFSGESLLQAWFLLLNRLFLFISQEMGLGSPLELLGCAAVTELTSPYLRFSQEEYVFLREYDQRAG